MRFKVFVICALLFSVAETGARSTENVDTTYLAKEHRLTGKASYYGPEYGRQVRYTASGQLYNQKKLTVAHLTLPFGTRILVKNVSNGKAVEATVTDRGPAKRTNRILDCSTEIARRLGFLRKGVTDVEITVLDIPDKNPTKKRKKM
jgi:rare lipoprotein A